MPIYEYNCKQCGDFEITQRMSENALKKCPTCGAKVTKLISTSAFHLKGSGWYMTDYAKSGASKPPEKTDGDGSTGSTGSTESKSSETKESGSSSASASESTTKESAPKKDTSTSTSSATKETSATT